MVSKLLQSDPVQRPIKYPAMVVFGSVEASHARSISLLLPPVTMRLTGCVGCAASAGAGAVPGFPTLSVPGCEFSGTWTGNDGLGRRTEGAGTLTLWALV